MKIAILAHHLHPISEPYAGGLEMITHLLTTDLMDRGHDVDLYAKSCDDESISFIAFNDMLTMSYSDAAHNIEQMGEQMLYTDALLRIASGNYDLVHNHSLHYSPILSAELLNAPLITTFHTPVFSYQDIALTSNKIYKKTQVFTAVSRHLANIYSKYDIDPQVIYNGIDLSKWTFKNQVRKNQVCWYGRICKEKAPHLAVEAALKANCSIVLAGPISCERYFSNELEHYLIHPQVSYVGHLNQQQLDGLIGTSIATLFTSVWEEPYGLVIAESLACGTPVIAWNLGAAPEILSRKCGVILPEIDTVAMSRAIEIARTLERSACRARAEEFCSVKAMTEGYIHLYRNTVNAHHIKAQLL